MRNKRHRLVVDTDLGSDVDDALALALLLGSPEVSLEAVTTVYGDTLMRARMAAQLARLAGSPVPTVPGAASPLSGRPVWLSGEELTGWQDLDAEPLHRPPPPSGTHTLTPTARREPVRSTRGPEAEDDAARWLVEAAAAAPGELEILAIGPLTNLARALRINPAFPDDVANVWLMGGSLEGGREPEHNFASDAVAAAEVLASGLRLTVVPLDVTRLVRLDEAQVHSFGGGPLGDRLVAQTEAWMRYWSEPFDVPHDALAALAILRPDLFTSSPLALTVHPVTGAAEAGGASSSQRVVTWVDVPAATTEILARIRRAAAAAPDDPTAPDTPVAPFPELPGA